MTCELDIDGRRITLKDGVLVPFEEELAELERAGAPPPVRRAHAAVHVVMLPSYAAVDHSPSSPGSPEELVTHIDWDATAALRRGLDQLGLGVAEAMDTAQRFEIGWAGARRLIAETAALDLAIPFLAGASSDQRAEVRTKAELVDAVAEQVELIRAHGGEPVLLPMQWLADRRLGEDDYVEVYAEVVRKTEGGLWVHWLGEVFHPGLAGYFPGTSFERVMALDRERIRGVKISLLDPEREVRIRRALAPHGQSVLTGDDLHFARLIAGDEHGHSHALLGVLDAVARPAALALRLLACGRRARYDELMAPCEALGRHLFQAPTPHYKSGLAFLAWLAGRQENPMLPNHLEVARDREHFVEAARLASEAGVLPDAALAAERLGRDFSR